MLIEFLNDYYAADFKKIHDIAGNQHLVGHSVRFDKDLFVKIFTESEMFYAEQNVNQVYCPEIYLDSVIFGDKYIVVLIDFAFWTCLNFSKILSKFSLLTPSPWSSISILTYFSSYSCVLINKVSPSLVNLIALFIKFNNTCKILSLSNRIFSIL